MFRLRLQPSSGQLVVQIRHKYCAYVQYLYLICTTVLEQTFKMLRNFLTRVSGCQSLGHSLPCFLLVQVLSWCMVLVTKKGKLLVSGVSVYLLFLTVFIYMKIPHVTMLVGISVIGIVK